jgi:hypothetical protein
VITEVAARRRFNSQAGGPRYAGTVVVSGCAQPLVLPF